MAHPAHPQDFPFFRPRHLPRVLRRHAPVLKICIALLLFGLVATSVVWRRLSYNRLVWDTGRNRAKIDLLNTEILHLNGQIELESSYPRVTKWAENTRHWEAISSRTHTFTIPQASLSETARAKANVLQMVHDE
ncbi:MAG: hypothetical protein PHI18_05625 [bacterium]|nr:hypothetical protein [bacterium]